jgi:hypothetical protein
MDLKQLCYPGSKRLNPELVDYHYSVLEQKKMTYQLDPSLTPLYLKMGPHYLKNVSLENLNLVADYSDAAGASSSGPTTPISEEAEITSPKAGTFVGSYKEEETFYESEKVISRKPAIPVGPCKEEQVLGNTDLKDKIKISQ